MDKVFFCFLFFTSTHLQITVFFTRDVSEVCEGPPDRKNDQESQALLSNNHQWCETRLFLGEGDQGTGWSLSESGMQTNPDFVNL